MNGSASVLDNAYNCISPNVFMFICRKVKNLTLDSIGNFISCFIIVPQLFGLIVSGANSRKSRHMVLHRGVL
jgi:hypothetical protein